MFIKKKLLNIICCPKTKMPLKILSTQNIEILNIKINKSDIKYIDGTDIEYPLSELLITEDDKIIYRIDNGIPILLFERGIHSDKDIRSNN